MSTGSLPLSRTEVVDLCTTYIQSGLLNVETAKVPMAPDCFRVENGLHCGDSPAGINIGLGFKKDITAATDLRWVVDGNEAVVFFGLHHGERVNHVTEYFRLEGRQLKELRPVFHSRDFRPGRYPGAQPETDLPAMPPPLQKGRIVPLAEQYFAALARRDPQAIPLGWDAIVKENGKFVARELAQVRIHLGSGFYAQLTALKVGKWVVEGPQVAAYFELKSSDGCTYTGWQYLREYEGLLRELESNYCLRTS